MLSSARVRYRTGFSGRWEAGAKKDVSIAGFVCVDRGRTCARKEWSLRVVDWGRGGAEVLKNDAHVALCDA